MADENSMQGPLKQGSRMVVTVEEAIADVLLVCLKHGAKLYRGVLLDSEKSGLPCMQGFTRISPPTGTSMPEHGGQIPEISALSKRHTYMESGSKSCASSSCSVTKDIPLRQKAKVRNMRLRPRQVLCSNCKRGIHDTVMDGGKPASEAVSNTGNAASGAAAGTNHPGNACSVQNRINTDGAVTAECDTKRQRLDEDVTESAAAGVDDDMSNLSKMKSNPVIKISYATPKGEGTIVKTLSMPDGVSLSDSVDGGDAPAVMASPLSSVEGGGQTPNRCQHMQKSIRKVYVKKAKLRVKCRTSSQDCAAAVHKRSKRGKHKAKRKHRHKEVESNVDETPSDEQYKENVATSVVEENGSSDSVSSNVSPAYLGSEARSDGEDKTSEVGCQRYSIMSNTDTTSLKRTIYRINSPLSVDTGAVSPLRPLTMRIHTRAVSTCVSANGQSLATGDVVWGKIHGFPWWPGCVGGMTESRTDSGAVVARLAHISWYGSSTVSHMPCSQLCPFLADFSMRYNRKKRGAYKRAIKQATIVARRRCLNAGVDCDRQLATYDIE